VQSGTLLAISSGNAVQLVKQGTIGLFILPVILTFPVSLTRTTDCDEHWHELTATWEVVARLPDPPKFPELEGELPEPTARSLHFLGANDDVLLVTYLDHGVM
jgi:hypothetical protein